MAMISYDDLLKACRRGGASTLTSVTELQPAAGPHASVAPAKFVAGNTSTFAFEERFVDGKAAGVVVIDSKQSQINRAESALAQSIRDGEAVVSRVPRLVVSYEAKKELMDLELPHRAFDGHIRAANLDGTPVTQTEEFQALRNSTPGNARPLLEASPFSLVGGVWDSTRREDQVRFRSVMVGEIIGVLGNQETPASDRASRRGGARVDPVALSVQLTGPELQGILDAQRDELSPGSIETVEKKIKKLKKGERASASNLGLGAIPPQLDALGGVSCSRILRSWVLSFAALRQIRFGAGTEGDAACRALLAALAIAAIARSEEELNLRANCDLRESGEPVVTLDERFGKERTLDPFSVEAADELLEQAILNAREKAGVEWNGQELRFVGNPAIIHGAVDAEEAES
nr:type I-U CRISPR-associated RAMP protein Csb1/Cas7u [Corynebacterium pelargi]